MSNEAPAASAHTVSASMPAMVIASGSVSTIVRVAEQPVVLEVMVTS